ncbi:class 1a ribonucleoside-diphosphate reductase subunit alpha [Enterobacteriaceae endosymbiont of Macroplea appendiculata]|uniref:class 1a ribonucleoside-diphosphate reductase subunit alpha n=1 Tax=Enterobacteriaceae endosymbiont of Macroplea appendiculata TaxID=2675790 RepID=UPI001449DD3A|nr:class 1a ribonucleoside-diphosphate reductase subunit alpha [Enterobacteriaceae endosymbiont of Macroplea appendiculata]QJC30989.1 ribonucleoside-diphosphate reductase subunit alpha [Enterobacteriaceae endosymbiont of Macroplea appendiculata]
MHNKIYVIKKNNRPEIFNWNKIYITLSRAMVGLTNISIDKIKKQFFLHFYNNMHSTIIQETLIKITADFITEKNPDFQYMAARLNIFNLRKKAYGKFLPPKLYQHVKYMVDLHKYDPMLLKYFSKKEFQYMDDNIIQHDRDMLFTYVAVKQLESKYLVQNRITGKIYESAQFLYILISACLFAEYHTNIRMEYIKNFYHAISTFKISLPTPIMSGVRTLTKQFSSCILIECGDSIDSINATTSTILKYVSQKAGIGINAGRIRAVGSPIRNGEAFHTGCIPFYKHFQTAIKSCSQGGVRGGAGTLFYPLWHYEINNLLVLKNNKGIEDNRIRHLDYGVQINKLLYQRLINGIDITLFSPSDVPGLYEAFFTDQEKFSFLYHFYENNNNIRKKSVNATNLFSLMMRERTYTGRIYIQNVDHCNYHSAFNATIAPIKQSNLCLEVTLPTTTLNDINDPNGEIGICTLAAFNLGMIKQLKELKYLSDLLVRALNNLLDYQEYLIKATEKSALGRRSLGIGVINFAYYLAKNNVRYSDNSANNLTHKTFEAIQYYLLCASNHLAKEEGACPLFKETNYYNGILPIDTYKKDVDELHSEPLHYPWEKLRKKIIKYGLRNSTLTALMPSETSSQISNATNGIEPPRGLISIKTSKHGTYKQVVPEYHLLKNKYELIWDMPNNYGYLNLISLMQKFIDQSISTNLNYDPKRFKNNKITMQQLLKDILIAYKLGIKTLYYQNTRDGAKDVQNKDIILENNHHCINDTCIM